MVINDDNFDIRNIKLQIIIKLLIIYRVFLTNIKFSAIQDAYL